MHDEPTNRDARFEPTPPAALLARTADAASAGMPLDEVFLALAEDADDRKLRNACLRLAEEIGRGVSFRQAVATAGPGMPAYVPQALLASADSGSMAAVLQGLAQQSAVRKRMRRRIWSALLYPLIVVFLLGMVATALVMVVVPEFQDLYAEFGLTLPRSTIVMLALAEWAPWLVIAAAAVVLGCFLLWLAPGGRRLMHWLRTGAPLFGRMWIWAGQHEFASVLGVLTAQGVALSDALESTAASLRDRNVARATRIVARKCEQGTLLSRGLSESIHFDPALPALVSWGEMHDALPEALQQAAAMFEEEIDVFAYFLHRALPPLMFASVILLVIAFITVIMVPLIDLINNLVI
jgi:type II secretory pathway component PulF